MNKSQPTTFLGRIEVADNDKMKDDIDSLYTTIKQCQSQAPAREAMRILRKVLGG